MACFCHSNTTDALFAVLLCLPGDADRVMGLWVEPRTQTCNQPPVRAYCDCTLKSRSVGCAGTLVVIKSATDAFVRSEPLRVDHDLAYESGYAEAHFANGMVSQGRYSTVWKIQSDGHWKIFRNLSLPPAPK